MPSEVDVEHASPVSLCALEEGFDDPASGIVGEHVDRPEAHRDRRRHRLHLSTIADIGRNRKSLFTGKVRCLFRRRCIEIDRRGSRSLCRKGESDRPANVP